MIFIIKDAIYTKTAKGYAKCELHKKKVGDKNTYYLVETKDSITRLPVTYSVASMSEIIAKFGRSAITTGTSSGEVPPSE